MNNKLVHGQDGTRQPTPGFRYTTLHYDKKTMNWYSYDDIGTKLWFDEFGNCSNQKSLSPQMINIFLSKDNYKASDLLYLMNSNNELKYKITFK